MIIEKETVSDGATRNAISAALIEDRDESEDEDSSSKDPKTIIIRGVEGRRGVGGR